MNRSLNQKPFFCSWSGGKDSSLALYKAVQAGGVPFHLLTMMIESGERSRSHGIPKVVLEEQARCMGIPIRFCASSWNDYTENFTKELTQLYALQICHGVFGDIDIESHREWVQNTCLLERMDACLPLWQTKRDVLLDELMHLNFRAEIIAVKENVLPRTYLGKVLSYEIIREFKHIGIDACGENGEYHTLVTDGPIFKRFLPVIHGQQVLKDGYWFSDVALKS